MEEKNKKVETCSTPHLMEEESEKGKRKNLDPPGNGGKRWNEVPQAHQPQTRKNGGKDQKLVPLLVALEEAQQQTPEKDNVWMKKG